MITDYTAGVIFAIFQFDYTFLESLLFSLSALTCGGFVSVPDEGVSVLCTGNMTTNE